MSLKVISTIVKYDRFPFSPCDGMYKGDKNFGFSAFCNIDGVDGLLVFDIKKGCYYNGASNPINWPIKNYYNDAKKDCCGLGHDILYALGGKVKGLGRDLKAGESDDYIRGAMREAGFSRKEAGIVDWAVRTFAHHGHYGIENDKENMHSFCTVTWKKL